MKIIINLIVSGLSLLFTIALLKLGIPPIIIIIGSIAIWYFQDNDTKK